MLTFYFDMDGTIADLYGIEGWLEDLKAEKVRPYAEARPLVNCEKFIGAVKKLKAEGYNFGIISWTSKNGSKEYRKEIRKTKIEWLNKYFPECFDEIHIIKYGTPKSYVTKNKNGWLFDDEEKNREKWIRGKSFSEKEMVEILGL